MRETAHTIRNKILRAASFIAIAFIFSLITLLAPSSIPANEAQEIWFQRSGSFIVITSIWAEFVLIRTEGYVDPYNEKYMVITEMPASVNSLHRHVSKAAIFFALYGTLIWGYGDYIVKNI